MNLQDLLIDLDNSGIILQENPILFSWGCVLNISENYSKQFVDKFFDDSEDYVYSQLGLIHPRIIIKNENSIPWHFHTRRSEIINIINGNARVILSDTDHPQSYFLLAEKSQFVFERNKRHKIELIGNQLIFAEIWQHNYWIPSDEDDVIFPKYFENQ